MPGPRPHPMRSLFILSLSALAFALAQTTLIPALTELAKSLHTDASGVAWTITGYLLSAAVCTPVLARAAASSRSASGSSATSSRARRSRAASA
jgi:predicted MFS family arabinose efflux permease